MIKSKTTPLLLELSNEDLNLLCKDDVCGINISIALAKEIYDAPLQDTTETNLIFIDADNAKDYEHTYLLEEFFKLIEDQVQTIKTLGIAKETISAGLSFATGGLLKEETGDLISSAVDSLVDAFSDDIIGYTVDATLEHLDVTTKVTDILESKIFDFVNDNSVNFLDNISQNTLYLSKGSKEAIKELSENFKENLTPAESFRLMLQLILSVAIDMPTLLYIKNPHKLDKDSLAILSLLFSYAKDVKQSGKHTNLSVVYAYEDEAFQPYSEVQEKYELSKSLLDEQRIFTQRYAMLERPTSDIPHIAVKSSIFVGRQKELKNLNARYHYSKEHQKVATLETISGEPGIGKTKLVKKHLEQIRKEEEKGSKQIQLTLLNQVGHASSNTGLGSLTDAIIKEASRLETAKTLQERVTDKAKSYILGAVVNKIKSTLGVDAVLDIGSAIGERVFLEGQMEKTKQNTIGDLDNKSQEKKEQQFLKLTQALKELKELSDESMPIVLFIDDLQWIDEDSAEYIIKHFIKEFNVHIVSTLRRSDSRTVLRKAYDNREQNLYKIALLKKAGIELEEEIDSEVDTDRLEFSTTHLLGLDQPTLSELISQVIKPIDANDTYQEILATTIIEKFEDKNAKGTANTLFTIETINMLCDEKLYTTQNKEIEQLILTEATLRFNPNLIDFKTALEHTFKILNDKYKKAFEHINAEQNETEFQQKFNLMAYAVLEERLNILRIYFAGHGNAAVNTLLFSSWLGTIFNSQLVRELLQSLANTNDTLLKPLKEYIRQGKNSINIDIHHYEIIEEVYEILNRYTSLKYAYEHSHSLLSIFLDKQLEYIVRTQLNNNMASLNRIYTFISDKIINYDKNFLELETAILFLHNIAKKALINNRRFDNIVSLYDWYLSSFQLLYDEKKLKLLDYNLPVIVKHIENEHNLTLSKEWRERYFNILWKAVSLNDRLFNKDNAIGYLKQMYPIIEALPNSTEYYIQKGEFYYKSGGYKYLHVSYKDGLKELLLSIRYLKKIDQRKCNLIQYTNSQATISYAAGRIGELLQRNTSQLKTSKQHIRLLKALHYHKKSLSIISKLVAQFPYDLTFLTKLGVVYERIGQAFRSMYDYNNALNYFNKAMLFKEKYFYKTNESFGYRKILIVFSDFYRENNMTIESNKLIEKAMSLTNDSDMQRYIKNEDQYQLESYIKIYTRYFEITQDITIKKKLQEMENISKNRGLRIEY